MKITYKGDYALKALLDLAVNYEQGVSTIHDVAKRIDAPVKFLEQVLLELKNGGFVESKRGKVGGYSLAKVPSSITLGEVVRFIDGSIEPIACVNSRYSNCRDLSKCIFKGIWEEVTLATSKIIDNVTFDDLKQKVNVSLKVSTYSI